MTHESYNADHFNEIVAQSEKSEEEKDAAELYEINTNTEFVKNVLLSAAYQARELNPYTPVGGIVNFAGSQTNATDRQMTYQRFRVEPGVDVDQDKYYITDATVTYDEAGNGTEESTEYILDAAIMKLETSIQKILIEPDLTKHELERFENPTDELSDNKDADREDIERILVNLKLYPET